MGRTYCPNRLRSSAGVRRNRGGMWPEWCGTLPERAGSICGPLFGRLGTPSLLLAELSLWIVPRRVMGGTFLLRAGAHQRPLVRGGVEGEIERGGGNSPQRPSIALVAGFKVGRIGGYRVDAQCDAWSMRFFERFSAVAFSLFRCRREVREARP